MNISSLVSNLSICYLTLSIVSSMQYGIFVKVVSLIKIMAAV